MNEHITDIETVYKTLTEQDESKDKVIDSQQAQINKLTRTKDRLLKKVKELQTRLSKYENQDPPKDISNSSTPPSKEKMKSEFIRRTKSLRKKSDKPIGGQKGHVGYTREMVGNPDEIITHHSSYCQECGADLSSVDKVLEYTTQELEIPMTKPQIKEHRHYLKVCGCGCHNRSYPPPKRGGNDIVFGKNAQALVVYYNVVQCVPYARLQSMFKSVHGIEISQGSISNIIQSARKKAEPAIALIKKYISKFEVVGFDESGCYCNGRLDWSWIAQTANCTLVFRANGRKGKVLEDMFGQALNHMTAVTDRHSAYFSLNFISHQICLAHILRELQYLGEINTEQQWSREIEELLKEAIHLRNENPQATINPEPWYKRLDELLQRRVEQLGENFRKLKNGLVKCRDYVFKFLENPLVPPTNNASERGFRKLKVKQKISGIFRSDSGADAFFDLHSIVDTAHKNNQPELNAILAILDGEMIQNDLAE